jgi:chemotaxis family two-component system sensor kinase Cph1
VRVASEFFGHMVSFLMAAKEGEVNRLKTITLREHVRRLVDLMNTDEPFYGGLLQDPTNALSILESGGAAVVIGSDVHALGISPDNAQIDRIAHWLETTMGEDALFSTDRLQAEMEGAEQFQNVASGLLAIRISLFPRGFALWFRPEISAPSLWAGNPSKPVKTEDVNGEPRLTRRTSSAWKER